MHNMNTNREKTLCKKRNTARSSCSKHCKSTLKSESEDKNNTRSHTPTVRCHEEVYCKIPSTKHDYFTCELDGHLPKTDIKGFKQLKSKENIRFNKSSMVKHKPYKESKVNVDTKDVPCDTMKCRSKSVPIVQKPNLEESVDFIPVKLSNKTKNIKRTSQKHETKSVCSENLNKKRGPTWDQLLKGDSENVLKNNLKDQTCHRNDKSKQQLQSDSHNVSKKNADPVSNDSQETDLKNGNSSEPTNECYMPSSRKSIEILTNKCYFSNPVKTLDILIEKLREQVLKQPQNDNLNKIILDMESALTKISFDDYKNTTEPDKYSSVKSSIYIPSKSPQPAITKPSNNGELDITSFKKNLEESCLFLQSLCIKQRESCSNHIQEKEQLSIQLAESRRLLAIDKSKAKDYEKTIGELRLQLQEANSIKQQQFQTHQELNENVAKLKCENEVLKTRFKESLAEKDNLQSKLYIKDLEMEKLKVLLEVKQNVNPNIKHFHYKGFEQENTDDDLKINIPNDEKGKLYSLPSESSLTLCKARIICSSQSSRSPRRSPSPYDSWRHISSIPQDLAEVNDLRNSVVRVFNTMKADKWDDSLDSDLEEPLVPSLCSDEDVAEINLNELKIGSDNFDFLSS